MTPNTHTQAVASNAPPCCLPHAWATGPQVASVAASHTTPSRTRHLTRTVLQLLLRPCWLRLWWAAHVTRLFWCTRPPLMAAADSVWLPRSAVQKWGHASSSSSSSHTRCPLTHSSKEGAKRAEDTAAAARHPRMRALPCVTQEVAIRTSQAATAPHKHLQQQH